MKKTASNAIGKLGAMARMEPRAVLRAHTSAGAQQSRSVCCAPLSAEPAKGGRLCRPSRGQSRRSDGGTGHLLLCREYSETLPDAFGGRFHLMNKTVDFGSIEAIDWRVSADDGARQIWRSNLSQMSYLPVALLRYPDRAVSFAARVHTLLSIGSPFREQP